MPPIKSREPDPKYRTSLDPKRLNTLPARTRHAVLQKDGWIAELRQKIALFTARQAEFLPYSNEWKYFDAQIRQCHVLLSELWPDVSPYQAGGGI